MRSEITLALSILILIGLAYQIRTSRRIDKKLNKLLVPERNPRIVAQSLEKKMAENYRQSEFYLQLLHILDLKAPIPATRGWAGSPDVLLTLIAEATKSKPARALDLGSGVSTLVLGKIAPQASVISIDNSPEYGAKTRELLDAHQITNVDLRIAPLKPHADGVDWYDLSQFTDIDQIDLLFIDGPPSTENNKRARHPAISVCLPKLSPRAIIVIDDAGREGEREMAELFAQKLPNHRLEFLGHEKITAVLLPR
jgi:predicted O-methyltransferase YrrM